MASVDRDHCRTLAHQLLNSLVIGVSRQIGVEVFERGTKTTLDKHLAVAGAAFRACRAESLVKEIGCLPAEFAEQFNGGLLDQGAFRIVAGGGRFFHTVAGFGTWRCETSISPEMSLGKRRSRVWRKFWFFCLYKVIKS